MRRNSTPEKRPTDCRTVPATSPGPPAIRQYAPTRSRSEALQPSTTMFRDNSTAFASEPGSTWRTVACRPWWRWCIGVASFTIRQSAATSAIVCSSMTAWSAPEATAMRSPRRQSTGWSSHTVSCPGAVLGPAATQEVRASP